MQIYQHFYNILSYRIFGSYALQGNQDLVCTLASFVLSLAFLVLPLIIVFKIVRFICEL